MVCQLQERNGKQNWCQDCGRYHIGHMARIMTTPGPEGDRYRLAYRVAANGHAKGEGMQQRGEPCGTCGKGKPGVIVKARNYIGDLRKHKANGSIEVPAEVRAERRAKCEACQHRDARKDECNLCGCPLHKTALGDKLAWAISKCPDGRWGRWSSKSETDALADQIDADHQCHLAPGWWLHGNVWDAFRIVLQRWKDRWHDNRFPQGEGNGIVIVGGGKYFVTTYVNVRLIRYLGCSLPIQVWYLGRNNEMPGHWRALLNPHGVDCVDADEVRKTYPMRILNGWELKPYAVAYSKFNRVLFLDADCHPMREPSFLLHDPRFLGSGAMFWRDNNINVGKLNPDVWKLFGFPAQEVWALESGAFLVDRQRWSKALWMTLALNAYSDLTGKVVYGDKDTFQIGAKWAGQTFAIPPHMPGGGSWGFWQKWYDGSRLFQHRIHAKWKLGDNGFKTPQDKKSYHGLTYEKEMRQFRDDLKGNL